MITRMIMALGLLLVAACADTSGVPNFERMSETELAEYNRERPLSQMIVCSEENRSFSRVRRRRCATVEQMYGSLDELDQLDVLNVPGISAGGNF